MIDRMTDDRLNEICRGRYNDPLTWSTVVDELLQALKAERHTMFELEAKHTALVEKVKKIAERTYYEPEAVICSMLRDAIKE